MVAHTALILLISHSKRTLKVTLNRIYHTNQKAALPPPAAHACSSGEGPGAVPKKQVHASASSSPSVGCQGC